MIEVLSPLQGLLGIQRNLKSGNFKKEALCGLLAVDLRCLRRLPDEVAARLTELDVDRLKRYGYHLGADEAAELARMLTDDKAFAQVLRAVNHYRQKVGYEPLGPDGWPVKGAIK